MKLAIKSLNKTQFHEVHPIPTLFTRALRHHPQVGMEQRFHFDGLMRRLDAEMPNRESRRVFSFIHYTINPFPHTPVNTASHTQHSKTFSIDPATGYDREGTVVKLLWGRAAPLPFPPSLLIGLWRARKVGFPSKRKTLGTDPWCYSESTPSWPYTTQHRLCK